MNGRVTIIDDDSGFVRVLCNRLEERGIGHSVLGREVGPDALARMRAGAIVVDLAIVARAGREARARAGPASFAPGAWEWLERTCAALPSLPVLVCTLHSTVGQRVRALRMGTDDWIAKPCHPEEVVARIERAATRRDRVAGAARGHPIRAGELEVVPERFQARVRGRGLELTRREVELLALLASAEGRVLEREQIYARVWGYAMVRGDRSVDVFVRKLRHKLRLASPGWRYIHTHFGVGYRFAAEPLVAPSDARALACAPQSAPSHAHNETSDGPLVQLHSDRSRP